MTTETETLFYTAIDELTVHVPIREKEYGWSVRQIVSHNLGFIVVYERFV